MIEEGMVIQEQYTLIKKLGEGSQASVWSAVD
jgi:hypothetical protein